MIYSSKHNFLLLKNHKVGGTSLEVDLSKVLPEEAIVTPKTSNHPAWNIEETIDKEYLPRNYKNFYNHISYEELSNFIDLSSVKAYVFVRHPFNAVLSDFFHRLNVNKLNNFWHIFKENEKKELVNKYFNNELGWNWYKSSKNIYTINNSIIVDKVLKYENGIENQINPILTEHSIKNIKLTSKEKEFRPKEITYFDVFTENQLNLIYEEWSWEFETFGYSK